MTIVQVAVARPQLSQLVQQASNEHKLILLAEGEARALLVSVEAFEALLGILPGARAMPLDELQREFGLALKAAGYDNREKLVELVRDVKREMAEERHGA